MMFCDLVGSTALSEKLDPEELRNLLHAYRILCGDVIARYDGFVARYVGDGILTYFGWPTAHEEDAERAALEIVHAIKQVGIVTVSGSGGRWCTDIPWVVSRTDGWRCCCPDGRVVPISPAFVEPMPYKFNERRRHKIPKARYRVTNWPAYDAALVRRGSLTVWLTEEAVSAWQSSCTNAHRFHKRRGDGHHPTVRAATSPSIRPGYNPGYIRAPTPFLFRRSGSKLAWHGISTGAGETAADPAVRASTSPSVLDRI